MTEFSPPHPSTRAAEQLPPPVVEPEIDQLPPPAIVSRRDPKEGGFTVLKRGLATSLDDPGGRVLIESGGLMIEYVHNPTNQTFTDGVVAVQGDDPGAWEAFSEVASQYSVPQGLHELEEARRK